MWWWWWWSFDLFGCLLVKRGDPSQAVHPSFTRVRLGNCVGDLRAFHSLNAGAALRFDVPLPFVVLVVVVLALLVVVRCLLCFVSLVKVIAAVTRVGGEVFSSILTLPPSPPSLPSPPQRH